MLMNSQQARKLVRKTLFQSLAATTRETVENYLSGACDEFPSRYGNLRTTDLDKNWSDDSDRTKLRYFHGLIFLQGWASLIESEGNTPWLHRVERLIRNWKNEYPVAEATQPGMAYHDETTAQRLNQLLTFASISNLEDDAELLAFFRSLCDETVAILLDDDFHSGLNNHGMFQDISLRNYAVMAFWADPKTRDIAMKTSCVRLREYFLHAFTSEGVHVENTPTYHLMVARSLKSHIEILEALESPDPELEALYDSASEYAVQITMPNGTFPPISDTTKQSLSNGARNTFSEEFYYAATAGKNGTKPLKTKAVFEESGYAVYRSDWDNKESTYVLLQAAYNNDYHKHSDDLSLLIYGKGQEIITDPGPYSYNYRDSFSRYAYSQFAHNNIIVDGKSTPRTDKKSESVKILSKDIGDSKFEVHAETGRLEGVKHQRQVSVSGDLRCETISVKDRLVTTSAHKYTQHWNLAPGLEVVLHGNGFEVFDGDVKLLDAYIETTTPIDLRVHSGQLRPNVLGWNFPSFGEKVPANVVQVRYSSRDDIEVETRFEMKNFSYTDRGLNRSAGLDWQRYETGRGLNYLELDNSNNDSRTPLIFVFSAMGLIGDFTFNYKSTVEKIDGKSIYILDDFGNQGSYYLYEKKLSRIFDTVHQFILDKISENDGNNRDIYFVGSSKGGSAALLHGLLIPGAKIFVGAPQTKIGTFVQKPHPNILQYMTGGQTIDHVRYLDDVLYDEKYLRNKASSVTIIVGNADHHYKNHVVPWVDACKKNSSNVEMIVLPGTPHSEIGKAYRIRLGRELARRKNDSAGTYAVKSESSDSTESIIGQHNVWFDKISGTLFATCSQVEGAETAYRLYRENEMISSHTYKRDNYTLWQGLADGRYRVRFFRRLKPEQEAEKVTSKWVVIN